MDGFIALIVVDFGKVNKPSRTYVVAFSQYIRS